MHVQHIYRYATSCIDTLKLYQHVVYKEVNLALFQKRRVINSNVIQIEHSLLVQRKHTLKLI